MVTPRGWGEGRRRREGVGKSPNPSRIIYSYIHISFYSKEHRVACPFMRHFCKRWKFACDLRAKLYFMSRGGLHLPPKIPTCFHQGAIFFLFFFLGFLFRKQGIQSCESFVAFFLSPSSPSFFRVTFCLTKDVKKHTQKNRLFFCVQSLRSPSLVYMQTICAPTQPMDMKGSWNN